MDEEQKEEIGLGIAPKIGDLVKVWYPSDTKMIGLVVKRNKEHHHLLLVMWQGDYGQFWTPEEELVVISEGRRFSTTQEN